MGTIVPGAHPSVNTMADWMTAAAFPTKTIKDIKPKGGIEEGFEFKIQNQLSFPICTGFVSYIQEYWQTKETGVYSSLSPLFAFKQNKLRDGLPPSTAGSTAKAAFDTLRLIGICQEILWPLSNWNNTVPTEGNVIKDAAKNRAFSYTRNPTIDEILISLDEGKPVGFSMYLLTDFFKKAKDGRVPKEVGGDPYGGHFMVAAWYDLDQEIIKIPQSWGRDVPTKNGYMEIPFSWFNYKLNDFSLLMDSYTSLDYIPPKELVLPKYITVGERRPTIEVNGQAIKTSDSVFAFIGEELGRSLVSIRTIEEVMGILTGKPAQVNFDKDTYTVKINL
jgi:hypothetical protein